LQAGAAADLLTRPLHAPDVVRRIGLIRRRDAALSQPAAALWAMFQKQMARHA
jgi:hypothetical protein